MRKKFVPDITVASKEEFLELFDCSIRTDLSNLIIDKILSNINSKKNIGGIFVYIQNWDQGIELTIKPDEFLEVLEEHLKIFEELEMYENCAKIHNGIKNLKIGNIIGSVKSFKKHQK